MKRIGFICCIIFAFIIGIPVMNGASDIMRAAEYTGEKVIDFDYFMSVAAGDFGSAYFITERHRVVYSPLVSVTTIDTEKYFFILDSDGKPIEHVIDISGSVDASDHKKKANGIALRDYGRCRCSRYCICLLYAEYELYYYKKRRCLCER